MNQQKNPKVLIVDDVAENIQVVANHLRGEEYDLLYATDGQGALDVLWESDVDLILLDVMMPGMSGFDVCRRLKAEPVTREIPVIFLTAKTDTDCIVEGFGLGGVDYITKPFNAPELIARVRTHIRLCLSEREVRALLAAKDRFLSIMVNELGAPFSSLRGILKIIDRDRQGLEEEELADYLRITLGMAEEIGSVIENLLSWAKLQTGVFGFQPTELKVADLIEDQLQLQRFDVEAKHLDIQLELEPGLTVYADPEMIGVAIGNLLSNAIKYSHNGGAVILRAVRRDDRIDITVVDRGVGIPAIYQGELFKLDCRLNREGTAGEVGSGLGLLLSKGFIEQNAGTIQLESEEGKGTSVRISIPASEGDTASSPA